MGVNGKQDQFRLGFLTAIEIPDKGFVGGLLVTNHFGRPLEFQCTMPVKPNATQEILYGPTLAPFVLGELIGGALIEKAGIKPDLILTDCEQILELRNHVSAPVAFVSADQGAASATSQASGDATGLRDADAAGLHRIRTPGTHSEEEATPGGPGGHLPSPVSQEDELRRSGSSPTQSVTMRLGGQIIRFHPAHGGDNGTVARESHQIPADANLCEPFERVREALQETLRCGALR